VERLERLEQALPYVSVAVERFERAQSWVERLERVEPLERTLLLSGTFGTGFVFEISSN